MEFDQLAQQFMENFRQVKTKKVMDDLDVNCKGIYLILHYLTMTDGEVIAGDISDFLNVSTARTATALRTLEEKKYIKKGQSREDGRKTIVQITDLGRIELEKRLLEMKSFIAGILEKLGPHDAKEFVRIFSKLNVIMVSTPLLGGN